MPLYNNNKGTISQVKEKPFKLERDIQNLFEENLNTIMGLKLVKSEFSIKNKRIDTLAFDFQNRAFIIIEYKREKNISVVDQGFTYLSLMLENKADFIVEYNESLKKQLKRDDVDWSQTRVVFVSPSFTENQKLATNFKDIAIELW
jgi:RecB family endonuclease NucS